MNSLQIAGLVDVVEDREAAPLADDVVRRVEDRHAERRHLHREDRVADLIQLRRSQIPPESAIRPDSTAPWRKTGAPAGASQQPRRRPNDDDDRDGGNAVPLGPERDPEREPGQHQVRRWPPSRGGGARNRSPAAKAQNMTESTARRKRCHRDRGDREHQRARDHRAAARRAQPPGERVASRPRSGRRRTATSRSGRGSRCATAGPPTSSITSPLFG